MVKTIAITGGKGGTGKTLIATNIAANFSHQGRKVLLVDCDVENPNSNILLGKPLDDENVLSKDVSIFEPEFDTNLCIKCNKCQKSCYRHAILQFPDQFPSLMEKMCSGCRTCQKICPTDAIKDGTRVIGKQYFLSQVNDNLDLLVGELKPSEAVSVLIVEEILEYTNKLNKENNYDIIVVDSAPGAHCDVEKSLSTSDLIIAVTEPTPFGEHDLKRILELIKILGKNKNTRIILNRSDLTDYHEPIQKISKQFQSEIMGEIPVDQIVIEDYAQGKTFSLDSRDFPAKKAFMNIFRKIKKELSEEI